MFKVMRTLTILSLAFSLCVMATIALASSVPVRTLEYTFKPVEMPKKAGPVKLEFAFKRKKNVYDCDEVQIRIKELHNLGYAGDTAWVMQIDSGKSYSAIFEVDIPPNDTSGIRVEVRCGRTVNPSSCYFVTTGDTLEFYKGRPSGHDPTPPRRTIASFVDTLTEEQLQTKYEVVLDLKQSADLKFVEGLLGKLTDTNIFDAKQSYYRLWMSLENIIEIRKRDIECGFIDPPLWTPEGRAKRDSAQPRGSLLNPESKTSTEPGAPSACGGMSNSFRGRPPEACPHLPLNG